MVLLVSSLFFYFFGEPVYCLLMIFSSLAGYLHGLWIAGARRSGNAKFPLLSSLITSTGLLIFFKYADFFIANLNRILQTDLPPLNLALPLGISFYTFQILSYTIDVYRGEAKEQKSAINLATYITLFPQLVAGPIVRYTTVEAALKERTVSLAGIAGGINRFIAGLSKKVLLANTLGELGEIFANLNEKTLLFYWLTAVAFTLQIYFDFSGYSDMAIGLGRILGFNFPENFDYPYMAKSITAFWRRWHISLGSWFRDYVYIPLGGNRVSPLKWIRNIVIVWFLTGFWHGAEWNFIVWGLYYALFLVLEKYFLKHLLARLPAFTGHIYTLFVVTTGFVLFNAGGLAEALENLKGMFGLFEIPFSNAETVYYLRSYAVVLCMAIAGATPLMRDLLAKLDSVKSGQLFLNLLRPVVQLFLLLLVTGYLIDGSFNPFLYFRF